MYCVIQKVINKKPDISGTNKELIADFYTFSIAGVTSTKFTYKYSLERFERPIKDAYKISIHKSYREGGKVKKKQWVICTMGYYQLLYYWPRDFIDNNRLKEKLTDMGIVEEELWGLIFEKLDPITKKIKTEFQQTEEYKAKKYQEQILDTYRASKAEFEQKYGLDTYDYCYDVFGALRNEEYLEKLKREHQQEYQRSYQSYEHSNYNNYDFSGYFVNKHSTYTNEEKAMLKKIYKTAALKFHPDVSKDDGTMMKFLTKLKEEWGI